MCSSGFSFSCLLVFKAPRSVSIVGWRCLSFVATLALRFFVFVVSFRDFLDLFSRPVLFVCFRRSLQLSPSREVFWLVGKCCFTGGLCRHAHRRRRPAWKHFSRSDLFMANRKICPARSYMGVCRHQAVCPVPGGSKPEAGLDLFPNFVV